MTLAPAGSTALTGDAPNTRVEAWVLNLKGWTTTAAKQKLAKIEAERFKAQGDPDTLLGLRLSLRQALDAHALARVHVAHSTHKLPTGQLFVIVDDDARWVWKEFNPATERTVKLEF